MQKTSKTYRLLFCLLLVMFAGSASAQHYIGIMGGWGGGMARFKPAKETGMEWGLYAGGLSYKFYSETKYVGGIEIDMLFKQKGFNYDISFGSDESYHRVVNSIEIPLIWQPHFYLFQRRARFFINLGIQASYNLSSTYARKSKTNGVIESGTYPMQLNRDNRFDYGLCGGAGLAFLLGPQRRVEFSVEARYGFGYGDILRNPNKYKGNPDRSPLDNINVFAAVYYRLGKGGIRSAASKATQLRMDQQLARSTLRRLNRQLERGRTPSDTALLNTLPQDSTGRIPIDSTTIETVRLYLTRPAISDTLATPDSLSPSEAVDSTASPRPAEGQPALTTDTTQTKRVAADVQTTPNAFAKTGGEAAQPVPATEASTGSQPAPAPASAPTTPGAEATPAATVTPTTESIPSTPSQSHSAKPAASAEPQTTNQQAVTPPTSQVQS